MRVMIEGLVLTLYVGVPETIWDATWIVTGFDTAERRAAFLHLYHLEIVNVLLDDVLTSVVRAADEWIAWWAELVLWLLLPGAACLSGCEQSTVPV